MRTNKILTMAMIMAFSGVAFTSCAIKDNETKAEQVEDPIKATTEYYINGKAVDSEGNLMSGVIVSAGENLSATTDANGLFTITVGEKSSFTVSASKESYLTSSKEVVIPSDAENRASVNVSFILAKKAEEVTITEEDVDNKDVVVSSTSTEVSTSLDEVENGVAVLIENEINNDLAGTAIAITEYISDNEDVDNEVSVTNVYITTSTEIPATGVTIAVANPSTSGEAFSELKVYKNPASSRSGETLVGVAEYVDGKYVYTFTGNDNLAGDYSFKVAYTETSSETSETIVSDKKENFEMTAIRDFQISYKEKLGWEYVNRSQLPTDEAMKGFITSAIYAKNGAEGVTEITKTLSTNISGESILVYTATNNVKKSQFTFKLQGGKSYVVETKSYTGSNLKYEINSIDQHSGGTGK